MLGVLGLGCALPREDAPCLWQIPGSYTAPPDECALVVGSEDVRLATNSCEASAVPLCAELQPGETIDYWRPRGETTDVDVYTMKCGELSCDRLRPDE